jgi:hypothetical protein
MGARTGAQDTSQFISYLHGGNEVPRNDSSYSGVGYFLLQGNTLSYLVNVPFPSFSNFLPIDAGIYGPAGRGTNGDLIFDWPTFNVEIASIAERFSNTGEATRQVTLARGEPPFASKGDFLSVEYVRPL